MLRKSISALFVAIVLALGASSAHACPNCKEAIAAQSPEEAARLKNGYFYSILLMVGMPFLLTGMGAFFVVRAVKRGAFPEL